jgi:hypothetical protein
MRIRVFSVLVTVFLLFNSLISFSQMSGAPDPDCDPATDPTCEQRAPITETIIILLAGGLGLGIRTASKKKKNN